MKIFDKIKDLFTDIDEGEERQIEIEETKKESKLPTIMRTERENVQSITEEVEKPVVSDRDLLKDNNTSNNDVSNNFRFPIAFETNDFVEEKMFSPQNVMRHDQEQTKRAKENYFHQQKKEKEKEKNISLFKASPVISPVYGILDKNYTKEELHTKDKKKNEINRNSSQKKVDFESVRKKAFGSLADDIKDNLSSSDDLHDNENKDLLYNMTEEAEDIKEITIGAAEDNYFDFGVAYENAKKMNKNENNENNNEVKIVNYDNQKNIVEKVEVEEPILDKSKQEPEINESNNITNSDNLELSDDIFNLIDNMYQEKSDDRND